MANANGCRRSYGAKQLPVYDIGCCVYRFLMGLEFVRKTIDIAVSAARVYYFSNSGVGKSLVDGAIYFRTRRVAVAIVYLWKVPADVSDRCELTVRSVDNWGGDGLV